MNLKRVVLLNLLFSFAALFSAGQVSAQTQTTGEIRGVVTDASGAAVAGAKIVLTDNSKGTTTSTETNKDGAYQFSLLVPSSYTVSAAFSGFAESKIPVSVALGQVTDANIQLAVGAASESVTVAAQNEPLLQTDNGNVSTSFNQMQLSETPNPGNDLTAFVQTAPGVVMNTAGGLGNFSDHGIGASSNLFTVDGMDDNDPFLNLNSSGATNLLLGSNEIQEADVVTNGFSTAYGTFSGIDVNYVTKSGGNQFHGNLVYYWNGSALNANDWFNNANGEPKPFDNANQWAASLGGPIKKDKLFFFLNTEGLRVLIPVPSNIFAPTTGFETAVV